VCSRVGLDFSINIIPGINGNPIGIFAGHYITAHRAAIELYKETYEFEFPSKKKYDIGFFNAYPEDTELSQSIKALNAYFLKPKMISYRGGVVMLSASTEGRGFHSLSGQTGSPLYREDRTDDIVWKIFGKRKLFFYSPNTTKADMKHFYPDFVEYHNSVQRLISELESNFGTNLKVCIVPSSIHLPKR
jgi:nickel-dependent lactate racemase